MRRGSGDGRSAEEKGRDSTRGAPGSSRPARIGRRLRPSLGARARERKIPNKSLASSGFRSYPALRSPSVRRLGPSGHPQCPPPSGHPSKQPLPTRIRRRSMASAVLTAVPGLRSPLLAFQPRTTTSSRNSEAGTPESGSTISGITASGHLPRSLSGDLRRVPTAGGGRRERSRSSLASRGCLASQDVQTSRERQVPREKQTSRDSQTSRDLGADRDHTPDRTATGVAAALGALAGISSTSSSSVAPLRTATGRADDGPSSRRGPSPHLGASNRDAGGPRPGSAGASTTRRIGVALPSLELPILVPANGADLRGVDLRGVDLRGADLRGAAQHGDSLHGASTRETFALVAFLIVLGLLL